MQKSTTKNFQETQKLGENLAKEILARGAQKNATVLALSGDLGAGKTTFLQGFAKGLGIKENILSPTFVIMKKFEIPSSSSLPGAAAGRGLPPRRALLRRSLWRRGSNLTPRFTNFYHVDYYRLSDAQEILSLGFAGIISDPKNIVAIEWPEKLGGMLPKNAISIKFSHSKKDKRRVVIDF